MNRVPNTAMASANWPPMVFTSAILSSFFAHSVAILVQYGRGGKDNE